MRKPNDMTLKDAITKMLSVYRLKGKYDETGVTGLPRSMLPTKSYL
jgi:hypothetical protein